MNVSYYFVKVFSETLANLPFLFWVFAILKSFHAKSSHWTTPIPYSSWLPSWHHSFVFWQVKCKRSAQRNIWSKPPSTFLKCTTNLAWVINLADIFYFMKHSGRKSIFCINLPSLYTYNLSGPNNFKECNSNADRFCILLIIFIKHPDGMVNLNNQTLTKIGLFDNTFILVLL